MLGSFGMTEGCSSDGSLSERSSVLPIFGNSSEIVVSGVKLGLLESGSLMSSFDGPAKGLKTSGMWISVCISTSGSCTPASTFCISGFFTNISGA